MSMKNATFKPEVFLKLSEWVKPDKNNKYELRVLRWIVNDVPKSVKVEKRSFYLAENQWKMGKVEGFGYADLKVINENMDKILDIMSKYDSKIERSVAKVTDRVTGKPAATPAEEETALPF